MRDVGRKTSRRALWRRVNHVYSEKQVFRHPSQQKVSSIMRWFISMNVGFVGVLSCLVLVLALFFSTGVASAHSTQAVHSQTSVTSVSTLQTCKKIYVTAGQSYYGKFYQNSGYVTVCQTCQKIYVKSGGYYNGIYYRNGGY